MKPAPGNCPPFEELGMLADGELAPACAEALRAHVRDCAACGAGLEDLERLDAALTEVLAARRASASRLVRLAWAAVAAGLLGAWILIAPRAGDEIEIPPTSEASTVPRIAMIEGQVAVRSTGVEAPRAAVPNQPLHGGDLVVTLEGQRAKLELPGCGELYVNERTEIRMPAPEDPAVKLARGEIFARSQRGDDGAALAVDTPLGVAEIHGHARLRLGPDELRLAMLDGRGLFRRQASTFDVSIGEELVVPRGERRAVVSEPVADRRIPDWKKRLEAVEFLDAFYAEGLSPIWRAQPKDARPWSVVDGVLTLAAPADGSKRRAASLLNLRPFEVGPPIAFEFLVRQPSPHAQGRSTIALLGQSSPDQKVAIRYSIGATDESLELLRSGSKAEKIWSERRLRPDRGWITIRIVLDQREIALERNGVDRVRRAHGMESLPPLRLHLNSVTGAPAGDGFSTEFARIAVRREE